MFKRWLHEKKASNKNEGEKKKQLEWNKSLI